MRLWLKVLLSVVAIALLATGVYSLVRPKNATPFRLSMMTWVGYGPFWLAQEKGFFKDEGVDVSISTIEDTAQRKSAVLKGDVDASTDTVDQLVLGRAESVPYTGVMQIDISNGADGILATQDIKSIQDLRGKKIAVQRNFVSEAFLDYVLVKNGLSPNDVQKVDMDGGAAGAAFVSSSVDVAVSYEPWLSKAKDRAGGHILVSSADVPGVIVDVLDVHDPYLKNHSDLVEKVIRAYYKAVDYWKANPSQANAIMAPHYNSTSADFADLISGLKWPTLAENAAYFGTSSTPGSIYNVANTFSSLFLQTGQIQNKPDMTKAIDGSILQKLIK